jgi:hypothetical protein
MPRPIRHHPHGASLDSATLDDATAKARQKVDEMRRKRDADCGDTWLRIIVAICTLGTPPTGARH